MADEDQGGNVVTMPDGTTHIFPLGTTSDQMQKALGIQPGPPSPQNPVPPQSQKSNDSNFRDTAIDFVRPFIGNIAGGLGAAGVSLIPGIGESGVAQVGADTQGYALVDSLMQYLKTKPPTSYKEALTRGEMESAINAVAGRIINSVWKGAMGVYHAGMPEMYKLAPTTSQVLENYGLNKLAAAPQFLEDVGASTSKAAALDRVAGKGFTQALAVANYLNGRTASVNKDPIKLADNIKNAIWQGVDTEESPLFKSDIHYASKDASDLLAGGNTPYQKVDEVLADRDKLAKVLKVGQIAGSSAMNVRKDLAAYQFMKMVRGASTQDAAGNELLDSNKLAKLYNDPSMQSNFDSLFGKEGKDRITNFLQTMSSVQQKSNTNPLIKYLGKGNFLLGLGLLGKNLTMGNLGGAAINGVQVGANVMGRLLNTETAGKAIMEAVEGTKASTPLMWRSRMVTNALQGLAGSIVDQTGKTVDGSFEEDPQTGMTKFVPHK